jgi:NAD-dependent deacetylase
VYLDGFCFSQYTFLFLGGVKMKKLVVLSGAGMSQESGIRTFRDSDGLWEEYDVMEVATPQGWAKNPELVMRFYNERRKQLLETNPNQGHIGLAALEKIFDVHIITQNIDDLHERAGSNNVLHLHGELKKARSTVDENLIYDIDGWELKFGDRCEKGSQLRPHIVWFGEAVPAIEEAMQIVQKADIFVVVGTSMNVYPAAGLINYVRKGVPIFLIDPKPVDVFADVTVISEKAGKGVEILKKKLEKLL